MWEKPYKQRCAGVVFVLQKIKLSPAAEVKLDKSNLLAVVLFL